MLTFVLGFILVFILSLCGWKSYQRVRARGTSLRSLSYRFKQKISMTAGLGFFFGGLYLVILFLAPYILNKDRAADVFSFGREHPGYILYFGLALFLLNALFICVIRKLLKELFKRIFR